MFKTQLKIKIYTKYNTFNEHQENFINNEWNNRLMYSYIKTNKA